MCKLKMNFSGQIAPLCQCEERNRGVRMKLANVPAKVDSLFPIVRVPLIDENGALVCRID